MQTVIAAAVGIVVLTQLAIAHRGHRGDRYNSNSGSYYNNYQSGSYYYNNYPSGSYYYNYPQYYYYYNYQPPQFPSELYNEIDSDALSPALCYLLTNDMSLWKLKYTLWLRGYSWSQALQIAELVKKIEEADFIEALVGLSENAFESLSDPGKRVYCNLLDNMPEEYDSCGYNALLEYLGDSCEDIPEDDVTTAAATTQASTTESATTQPPTTTTEATTATTTLPSTTTEATSATTMPPSTTTEATTTTTTTPSTTTVTTTAAPAFNCEDAQTIRSTAVTTRIVGGVTAQQGEYESFATLSIGNSINPVCGATIIDSCTILTAAHCVDATTANNVEVNVGDHTNYSTTAVVGVNQIIIHPDYNFATQDVNDLAILKVDQIDFTAIPFTSPACVADADFNVHGSTCTVVGTGTTSFGGRQPTDYSLLEVDVPIYNGTYCTPSNDILVPMTDPQNQFCAGSEGKDSCQGDSGGPLYCDDGTGQQVLTGVVSYGVNCGLDQYPGVYGDVGNYQDWITQNSGC